MTQSTSQNKTPGNGDPLADAIEAFAKKFNYSLSYASRLLGGRSTYYDDLMAGNRGNSDKRIAVFTRIENETEQREAAAAANQNKDG